MYGFIVCLLLGLSTEKDVRKQTRRKYITFRFLYKRLGPYLKKDDTHFGITVLVQERVAISLPRLDNGDEL